MWGMAGLGLLSPGLQRHMAAVRGLGCTERLLGSDTFHVFLLFWDPQHRAPHWLCLWKNWVM